MIRILVALLLISSVAFGQDKYGVEGRSPYFPSGIQVQDTTLTAPKLAELWARASRGRSYFVDDVSGDPNGDGWIAPITFSRLKALSATFSGNEQIFIKADQSYRGSVTIKRGSNVSPYGSGAFPKIVGTIPGSSLTWVQNGNVWSASYPTRVSRLFRNGVPEKNAESTIYTVTSKPNSTTIVSSGATGITNAAQMEMVTKEYDFRWKYHTITGYNTSTGSFTVNSDDGIAVGFGFKLFNHPDLISAEGDWACVNGTIYYKSPGNVNPSTLNVELSVYDEGIKLEENASGFSISGIDFFGQAKDGIYGRNVSNVYINGGQFRHQLYNAVALVGTTSSIKIYNIDVDSAMCNGIVGWKQSNYEYAFNKFTGIGMHASNWPFMRDEVSRYEWPIYINVAFCIQNYPIKGSTGGWVHHNEGNNLAYNGISVRSSYTTVELNHGWDFCRRANDGAFINTGSHEAVYADSGWVNVKGFRILNNYVHDGVGSFEATNVTTNYVFGIYCDNGEDGTEITGNTSANNGGFGFCLNFYTRNMIFKGNVAYNNPYQLRISNSLASGQFTTQGQIVENNTFASLSPSQYCIFIEDYESGGFNPFASGGSCKDNTFISPYSNNIIKKSVAGVNTNLTLAAAKTTYSQQFGEQDSYSASYVNAATAKTNVYLDVNTSPSSRLSVVPSGFRSPLNRSFDRTLQPYGAAVYITGAVSSSGITIKGTYADNASALAGGLTAGDYYATDSGYVKRVYAATIPNIFLTNFNGTAGSLTVAEEGTLGGETNMTVDGSGASTWTSGAAFLDWAGQSHSRTEVKLAQVPSGTGTDYIFRIYHRSNAARDTAILYSISYSSTGTWTYAILRDQPSLPGGETTLLSGNLGVSLTAGMYVVAETEAANLSIAILDASGTYLWSNSYGSNPCATPASVRSKLLVGNSQFKFDKVQDKQN